MHRACSRGRGGGGRARRGIWMRWWRWAPVTSCVCLVGLLPTGAFYGPAGIAHSRPEAAQTQELHRGGARAASSRATVLMSTAPRQGAATRTPPRPPPSSPPPTAFACAAASCALALAAFRRSGDGSAPQRKWCVLPRVGIVFSRGSRPVVRARFGGGGTEKSFLREPTPARRCTVVAWQRCPGYSRRDTPCTITACCALQRR